MDLKYLKLLSREYPNVVSASSEIINLSAINCLPKGTEFFFSDLHGEYEAFLHLLRSASGVIKTKINMLFSRSVSEEEREQLATLIYYPERQVSKIKSDLTEKKLIEWQKITIYRLIHLCKFVSAKYTRSKVRKKMPIEYSYIFDELLNVDNDVNKESYYEEIIRSIVDIKIADNFIVAICTLIRNLSVDSLHIIGDIFDRGPRADIIMDELINFHDVDIQWGNHDISWMGSASGNLALIANVIRMGISYNNFDLLEDGYSINLRALSVFASEIYKDDSCSLFVPHVLDKNQFDPVDIELAAKMHKAIAIIQFKLEGQLIKRHPEYDMNDRILLEKINYTNGTININNKDYKLKDTIFPTINPENPLQLTKEETELMNVLTYSFEHSRLLHKHIKFMYSNGSMYKSINGNLLYHGCIPMKENGDFESISFGNKNYSGKKLLDYLNERVNNAYFLKRGTKEQKNASDFMWYLWCGMKSPLFGKSKLSTFENYFIEEKEVKEEIMNPYYKLSEEEKVCRKILVEFGLNPEKSHIINGHVPVKIKEGESPIKANGKLYIIDGGISKAYQSKTGIAGYTLIYNSHNLNLAEHKPFIKEKDEIISMTPNVKIVEIMERRVMVGDTDNGKKLSEQIEDLRELIKVYRKGIIKENYKN